MNAVTRSKLIWNAVPTVFAVLNPPKQLATIEMLNFAISFVFFVQNEF